MKTKNVILSYIIFILIACGGNDKVPPTQSELSNLYSKDMEFIDSLQVILGSSIDVDSKIEFVNVNDGNESYFRIQSLNLTGLSLFDLPESIGFLDSLIILNLDNNNLQFLPQSLCLCPLKQLTFINNRLCLPNSIPLCLNEFNFNQQQNCISDLSIKDKVFFYELEIQLNEQVNIDSISQYCIENIDGLDYYRIESLDLPAISLTTLPLTIGNLDSLKILNLEDNLLESLPDSLCACPLEELTLMNNNICLTSSVPECVQDFHDVMNQNCIAYPDENDQEFLDELVSMNAVSDSISDLIQNDRVTWEIKLEGEGLVQRIVKLDLENLGLDTIPFSIGGLEHIEWIELENNNLTSIPESFGSLGELWYLDLYNNRIVDLPTSIQYLTKLQEFYIYSNEISELDFSFSNLLSLEKFWINDNQIEHIDSSICEVLVNLEFYYNNNKLCENLPTCLMNIDLDDQDCGE